MDARTHFRRDPAYINQLIRQTGLTLAEVATRLGLAERTLYSYALRDGPSKRKQRYVVQVALEALVRDTRIERSTGQPPDAAEH